MRRWRNTLGECITSSQKKTITHARNQSNQSDRTIAHPDARALHLDVRGRYTWARVYSTWRAIGGGGDRCDSSAQCMYTYTAPQKNSVLKGLLPTRATLTVYHKMSVYDFSFMIPFILYSLKELRLGLNCPMKLLPYGTQSITRNLGLYTYTKYFLLCISTANSRLLTE